jgi:hypothetical protein
MKKTIRAFSWPTVVTVLAWLGAAATGITMLVLAGTAARDATASGVFPQTLLGLPVLEGFRDGERIGVHLAWGAWLLVVVPLVVTVIATAAGVRRYVVGGQDA